MEKFNIVLLHQDNYNIPVFHGKENSVGDRNFSINVSQHRGNEELIIKCRDCQDYSFNYTQNIDSRNFEALRHNQSLDINFDEFKINLVEMLQQVRSREMLLKCELCEQKCYLIFFNKSKIKAIVFLTLELQRIDEKEIIRELTEELREIKAINVNMSKQISNANRVIAGYENEVKTAGETRKNTENVLCNSLKQVEDLVLTKQRELHNQVFCKTRILTVKIDGIQSEIEILRKDCKSKVNCNSELAKTIEHLRKEIDEKNLENHKIKSENSSLNVLRFNLEKSLADLRNSEQDKEYAFQESQRKLVELKTDLEKISIETDKRQKRIEELSKDLVKANGMLVNFNRLYDNKVAEVEELLMRLENYEELKKNFEQYRRQFNSENEEKLNMEVRHLNTKIHEMEETNRKLQKMNALLSEKINRSPFNYK